MISSLGSRSYLSGCELRHTGSDDGTSNACGMSRRAASAYKQHMCASKPSSRSPNSSRARSRTPFSLSNSTSVTSQKSRIRENSAAHSLSRLSPESFNSTKCATQPEFSSRRSRSDDTKNRCIAHHHNAAHTSVLPNTSRDTSLWRAPSSQASFL